MSDYVQIKFATVGLKEMCPCHVCRLAVIKHVHKSKDWKSAVELVMDSSKRVFGDEDPSMEELLAAVETRWGGTDVLDRIKENPYQIFEILESVIVVD